MQNPEVARTEPLETQEFFDRVLKECPRNAVFDCDGTLWSLDAGSLFLKWSMEQGMVGRETADWILGRYSEYRLGSVSEVEICGDMTRMYAGLREQEMRDSAARFFRQEIAGSIFPEMLELVRLLSAQGTTLWAVSSTNTWVVEEGVRSFGVAPERVLAASTVITDGAITDQLRCVPSGEAKRDALLQADVDADAVFGNSVHDAAMLAMGTTPYAVNPSAALLEIAAARGWPVYWPAGSRS